MTEVAVVGAGIAGAACARALVDAGVDVSVFERGHAPGGRLASPELHGRRVDLGAAYFTAADPAFATVVGGWQSSGIARQWTNTFAVASHGRELGSSSGPTRWSTPAGLRSVVRTVLGDIPVRLAAEVTEVIEAVDSDGGATVAGDRYRHVVLAMPDAQARRLLSGPSSNQLRDVPFDPVIAVASGWPAREWPFADGCFVNGDPVLSFVADDGARRGDGAAVLVAHTTASAARNWLADPDAAVEPVVAALLDLFGLRSAPVWTHAHRWTLAKPAGVHREPYGRLSKAVSACGDAWCETGSPRVESAWLSGTRLGEQLAAELR
ncbi:FAD-dependent oxidoreductase [Jatrophihabitans telluris]|uniref:FAD-dependent oxidoreductase n=1 Tax=Jatrophihabitans telluris TaxID=2038343 RepID=A0ABY4R2I4_9ACTN|nr:FAD-dependent oxidoreductase [Jatrophihabitans telluris]UQX90023.1 FAD-dependent oxidoreductase [Jatrophihabitans telluris]